MATIRQLRKNQGLSATQLAAKAGVSKQTVDRIEAGRPPVSREYVAKVCLALGKQITDVEGLNISD